MRKKTQEEIDHGRRIRREELADDEASAATISRCSVLTAAAKLTGFRQPPRMAAGMWIAGAASERQRFVDGGGDDEAANHNRRDERRRHACSGRPSGRLCRRRDLFQF
jgi:hypothetical protein